MFVTTLNEFVRGKITPPKYKKIMERVLKLDPDACIPKIGNECYSDVFNQQIGRAII